MKAEPTTASRRMILVLGMHRSGTSAVAGMLSHLGVDFSQRLVPAAEDNPKGFFEHADIWQQDHDILLGLGSQWDDVLALPDHWRQAEVVERAAAEAQAILQRDFADAALAGVKDPRMCRLVPAWRDWLQQAGFAPSAVLALRRPAEVIGSLARRDHLSADQAAWIWLRHVLESESATRALPRVAVRYEALLGDWRAEAARMAHGLALTWPCDLDEVAPKVDAFLEPSLRHNRGESAGEPLSQPLRGWIERSHAALTAPEGIDTAALDRVAAELAQADHAGAAAAAALRSTRKEREKLQADLRWFGDEHRQLQAGNLQLRENLDRHAVQMQAMAEGNAYLRENLDRHIAQLQSMAEGNAWLQANLDRHASRLQELEAGLAQASAERSVLVAERSLLVAERDLLVADRDRLAAQLTAVYASHSWRVTRPMRGAIRLARRLRGGTPERAEAAPPPDSTAMSPAPAAVPAEATAIAPARDPAVVLEQAFAAATGPRVLIVTPDILGPIRNGGIGTAFGALARTLAQAGHAVTILYTLGGHSEADGGIERWEREYAALGIRFLPVWLERGEPVLDAPHHAWRAYRVYLWLKQHQGDYDLAYFPEWKGEAYYALQAKRLGLDFDRLPIVVVTHSSTTWAESGNFVVPEKFDDLLLEFLERRSTEMADAVISPSQYMLDWMQRRGWRWHAPTHVIQNLMPDDPVPAADAAPAFKVTEWVFFGRLERRKGLLVFLDALRLVPPQVRAHIRVTFLGKAIVTPQFDSVAVIREKLADWPQAPAIISDRDRDQALDYLQQPGRVAVIASLVENSPYTVLECVLKRIPFVAADVGGIAELVHPEDRGRSLFKPTPASLAGILLALEGERYAPPRPAQPAQLTRQRWLDLQHELLRKIPAGPDTPAAPLPHITVCLVHYNRPALLGQAIDSLRAQTYDRFDVVLVDDGSPSAQAQQYLDSLQDEFAWRGWTIVRQANAYLGAARNAAARQARGDYLLFMDDDNIAKPDELAVFAQAASQSGADILTTVSDVFSDSDDAGRPPAASRQLWIPLGNAAGLGVFRNVYGDANALVRRSTFEALGGFTEDYGIGHEDWEFFARASLGGANLQLVPEPLFWYRLNASSMLRAGQSHIDHARSVRPYWEGFPDGVGAVLAYASHMQRRPPPPGVSVEQGAGPAALPRRRPWVTVFFRSDARARFFELLRSAGWRVTLARAARYIGRVRR